jgi:hypothetical protein
MNTRCAVLELRRNRKICKGCDFLKRLIGDYLCTSPFSARTPMLCPSVPAAPLRAVVFQ